MHTATSRSKKIGALLSIGLLFTYSWLAFKSDYTFTQYPLPGCQQPVTVVEYWQFYGHQRFFDRGAAFVVGEYSTRAVPTQECVIIDDLSGFDASFDCLLACEDGVVVLYYEVGLPSHPKPAKTIITRRLYSEDYVWMRTKNQSLHVQLY